MHRGLTPAGKQYLGAVATDRITQLQVTEACVPGSRLGLSVCIDHSVSRLVRHLPLLEQQLLCSYFCIG
jgi:hypothetical protein